MQKNNIDVIKEYIKILKYEILEKQNQLNELISILNNENTTDSNE